MGAQKPGLSSFVKGRVLKKTRMHSSRLSHSSSHRGGAVSVHAGIHKPLGVGLEIPRCGPGDTPDVGLETPSQCEPGETPWVWAWRPLGEGLETPQAKPLNFPPGCGPGNLQGLLGYHPPWRPAARHAGISPCGQNHSHE